MGRTAATIKVRRLGQYHLVSGWVVGRHRLIKLERATYPLTQVVLTRTFLDDCQPRS